jgi:hypothetical protein
LTWFLVRRSLRHGSEFIIDDHHRHTVSSNQAKVWA